MGRDREARDQGPRRRVPALTTDAAVLSLAGLNARRFRTKAARSARCAAGICAVAARCARQYIGTAPGGSYPRISRTRASWARESMASAIVSEQPHEGQLGFRLRATLLNPTVRCFTLHLSARRPTSAEAGRPAQQFPPRYDQGR
jgi:hypothetical protein